jgi:hypothetical protein
MSGYECGYNLSLFSCCHGTVTILESPNEGCKDEKNTVILNSHASNPTNIRRPWRYKVSKA